jgi:hypothetical protein
MINLQTKKILALFCFILLLSPCLIECQRGGVRVGGGFIRGGVGLLPGGRWRGGYFYGRGFGFYPRPYIGGYYPFFNYPYLYLY